MSHLWTSKEVRDVTGGESPGDWEAGGISIDTRTLEKGDMFIALKGEQFDGHSYASEALKKGASVAMVKKLPDGITKYMPHIIVKDTQKALEDMAVFNRERSRAKIVAVTGSVGKTSVKDALTLVLGSIGKTHSTKGNLNNHIGLPLTLARLPENCKYAVLEMGMNHAGELSTLTKFAKPDVVVITSIEPVHMEFFGSMESIADAKSEIFEGVVKGGKAVLPFDSPYFQRLSDAAKSKGVSEMVTFGEKQGATCRLISREGQNITAEIAGMRMNYNLPLSGKHNAINSLAVLAAVYTCGAGYLTASKAFASLEPTEGRGKQYDINFGSRITLIDDSYNASPASMRAAFSVLGDIKNKKGGRAVAVLGDMLELGEKTAEYHKNLKEDIVHNGVDKVFTAGSLMVNLHNVLPEEMKGDSCKDALDLLPVLKNKMQANDVVLIKGSHGSQMWKLAKKLLEEAG